MDPKMFEINNLRVLNDYLNQTIEVLVRAQRLASVIPNVGLSHSPYGVQNFLGTIPGVGGLGLDPTVAGLNHSPFLGGALGNTTPFTGTPFGANFGASFGATGFAPTYAGVVDPFIAQRGLSHSHATAFGGGFGGGFGGNTAWGQPSWSPLAEFARQQQIATATAFARQQQMLDAMVRGYGI